MRSLAPNSSERLRAPGAGRHERVRPEDADVVVRPRFVWLVAIAIAAVIVQSTLLRPLTLRGAHISLVTIVLVWTGLRCGVATGGFLGFIIGIVEDALGGGGANVLGATLAGLSAGLLNARFFADSLPIFLSAVAGATVLRGASTYLAMEVGLGERGMFHSYSHELVWQVVLNGVAAAVVLLAMRVIANFGGVRWPAR